MNKLWLYLKICLHPGQQPQTESEKRLRRAAYSAVAQGGNKFVQVLVNIVSVPILLNYLGTELFGLTIAIITFAQWFLFDTGIAEGMKIRLIECFAQENRAAARQFISTGLFGLVLLAVILGLVWLVVFPHVIWSYVFNLQSENVDLSTALWVIFLITLPLIPLKILREIYTADQRGYIYSMWLMGGAFLTLPGIWFAVVWKTGITGVLTGMQLPVLLTSLACFVYLFGWDMKELRPNIKNVTMKAWRKMWRESFWLLLLGGALMVVNGTDVFLVNFYRGGAESSVYALSLRIFFYVQVTVSFITYPAWPALGNAIHKRDMAWVAKASRALFLISFGFALPVCLVLVLGGRTLIEYWSLGKVETTLPLLLLLAVYVLGRIWCAIYGTLLRAAGRVQIQGLTNLAEAVLHIGLGIFLLKRYGGTGLAAASVISLFVTRVWSAPWEWWLVRKKLTTNAAIIDPVQP